MGHNGSDRLGVFHEAVVMRLLALTVSKSAVEANQLSTVNDVFAHNLLRFWRRWTDVRVVDIRRAGTIYPEADAAVVLMNNGLFKLKHFKGIDLYAELKKTVRGPVTVFETGYGRTSHPGDHVFHCKPRRNRRHSMVSQPIRYYNSDGQSVSFVGWAADSQRYRPKQDNAFLRLLVDHHRIPQDDRAAPSLTASVIRQCKQYMLSRPGQLECSFVADDLTPVRPGQDVSLVEGRLDNRLLAKALSRSHIFLATHWERPLGLAPLEAAMSGCLVVAPRNYISRCQLEYISHLEWEGEIDWDKATNQVSPYLARKAAVKFDRWAEIAWSMYETLLELVDEAARRSA